MSTRNETHLLSGAYALDAVTPEERALFEAALRESEELRGEVVGLTDTAVAIGSAVRPASPPPALRGALLEAIARTPQVAPESTPTAAPMVEPEPPAVVHLAPRRRRRMRRPTVLLAAAAVAALLFGGGVLVQRAVLQPDLQYSAIVAAADGQPLVHGVRGGGEATVYSSTSEGGSAIVLKGVTVPAGHVLQVWSVRGGHATSAGVYESGAHYRVIDTAPVQGESIAVTIEPAGGSERPTTSPIVSVALDA